MRSVALKELKIQLDAIWIQWIKNAWRIDEKLNPDPHVTNPDCYRIQSYQDTDHQVKGGPRKKHTINYCKKGVGTKGFHVLQKIYKRKRLEKDAVSSYDNEVLDSSLDSNHSQIIVSST